MKRNEYRLGLASISFRHCTPREIAQAAKNAGLSCIEWGSDVHAPPHDKRSLCALVDLQTEFTLSCSSYGTYFRLGQTPIEELQAYIDAAKLLQTDVLRLWCGTKSGEDYTSGETEALLEQCRQAAAIAEQNGVTLCMECHKHTVTQRCEDAINLIEAINSPHFRTYWQPFQWQSVEENLNYARRIAPFTHHLHVFQWKGEQRFSLADGMDEWRAYLSCFSLPRTLLLEFMPDDDLSSLPYEAMQLKQITGV